VNCGFLDCLSEGCGVDEGSKTHPFRQGTVNTSAPSIPAHTTLPMASTPLRPVWVPLPHIPIPLSIVLSTAGSSPMPPFIPFALPITRSGPSPISTGLVRFVFIHLHLHVTLGSFVLYGLSVLDSIIMGSRAWSRIFACVRMRVKGGDVRGRRLR